MKMRFWFLAFLIVYVADTHVQAQSFNTLRWKADSSYNAKSFAVAAPFYVQAGQIAEFPFQRKRVYYDAGCCFALIGQADQAFNYLTLAIKKYGYANLNNIKNDSDLKALHPINAGCH